MNVNKVTIGGRLGGDPEIKVLSGGAKLATFSVAVNGWKNKDTGETPVTWFRIKAFSKADSSGGPANTAERFLRKGARVLITDAEYTLESWTDKQSGDKIEAPVFIARRIDIIDFPPDEQQSAQPPREQAARGSTRTARKTEDFDDDIPF